MAILPIIFSSFFLLKKQRMCDRMFFSQNIFCKMAKIHHKEPNVMTINWQKQINMETLIHSTFFVEIVHELI